MSARPARLALLLVDQRWPASFGAAAAAAAAPTAALAATWCHPPTPIDLPLRSTASPPCSLPACLVNMLVITLGVAIASYGGAAEQSRWLLHGVGLIAA